MFIIVCVFLLIMIDCVTSCVCCHIQGKPGPPGSDGAPGFNGSQGNPGRKGAPGDSGQPVSLVAMKHELDLTVCK